MVKFLSYVFSGIFTDSHVNLIKSKYNVPKHIYIFKFLLIRETPFRKKIVKIAILRVDLCINININYFWEYLHKMLCAHVSFYKISYI